MSFLFKLFLIISYTYLSSSISLLNQSPNYDNFFFYKNTSLIESYLYNYLHIDKILNKFGFSPGFIDKVLKYISDFWIETNIIPTSYIFNTNLTECILELKTIDNLTSAFCLESTGKHLNDLGNEHYCINKETLNTSQISTDYFLIQSYFENGESLTNEEDKSFLEFHNQKYFTVGICMPRNCYNITNQLLKEEKTFLDFLYWKLNISNFTVNTHYKSLEEYQKKYQSGNIITIFLFIIILIKFLIGLLRTIIITKGYERYYIDKKEERKKKQTISLSVIDPKNEKKNLDIKEKENEKKYNINDSDSNSSKNNKNNKNNIENEKHRKESTKSLVNKKNENDIKEIYTDYIYGSSAGNDNNLYNPFYDNQDKYSLRIKIIKYLDLFDNLKILITMTNKYYNSCNIKKIYFLKFISMFMTIVLKVILGHIKMPSKNYLVYKFYQSFFFFLIKLCIFSSIFWIILDAVTAGFKLMSYIKKKIGSSQKYDLTFFSLFKFLFLLIPKIILFIICFFLLHIFSKYLTFSLNDEKHIAPFILYDNIIHKYTYSIKDSNENFLRGIKYLFPIYINYLDYFHNISLKSPIYKEGDNNTNPSGAPNYTYYKFDKTGFALPSPFLTNTDLFINIYLNEFVLFLFMIMITYLSYKLRKKLFDYFILIINIVLYIIPLFNLTKYKFGEYDKNDTKCEKCERYNLPFVLGQYFSEKYTHYFINFYYFGFIIGVMMFYYNENINSKFHNPKRINIYKSNNSSQSSNTSYEGLLTSNESQNNILLDLLPFSFCNDFIMILHNLKFWLKRTILFICLFFIFLVSCSFYIIQETLKYNNKEEGVRPEITIFPICVNNPIIKFIFLYEKNVFGFFFFIALLMFIVYPPNNNLVKFSQLSFFILFDRINFSFFCTYSYIVYTAYCVFYLDFRITYINLFMNSLGLFILSTVINVFIVCTFELPFRMIIKSQMNKNVGNEFRMSFTAGGLISNRNTVLK